MSDITTTGKKLPTLAELHYNVEQAFKNDKLNLLLNQKPLEAWVKTNPYAGNTKYIRIQTVEFLLTRIFQKWRAEVVSYTQLFNSVACHVRLHYLNPTTGEWEFHDGLGAVGIQTDAGKPAADLSAIKQNAVMMALPAAKSYAIKDAAEHLGALFGRDLNRVDSIDFAGAYDKVKPPTEQELETAIIEVKKFEIIPELIEWANDCHEGLQASKEFVEAVNKRINELTPKT